MLQIRPASRPSPDQGRASGSLLTWKHPGANPGLALARKLLINLKKPRGPGHQTSTPTAIVFRFRLFTAILCHRSNSCPVNRNRAAGAQASRGGPKSIRIRFQPANRSGLSPRPSMASWVPPGTPPADPASHLSHQRSSVGGWRGLASWKEFCLSSEPAPGLCQFKRKTGADLRELGERAISITTFTMATWT